MRFYSNGNWSVGPIGALILGMLYLAFAPIWIAVGIYRIYKTDVLLGHVAVGGAVVIVIIGAIMSH